MAFNDNSFVRIVPESTGDRIAFKNTIDIEFTGRTANPILVGDTIIGATSGTMAEVLEVIDNPSVANTGIISVNLNTGYEGKTFTASENLTVNALVVAVVSTSYDIYNNTSIAVGANNPKNGQYVDERGAAYTRFSEGSPQFDASGKLQVSQQHTVAEHIFKYDTRSEYFTDTLSGGGTLTHQPNNSGILLSTGTTSGDLVERISNRYYRYIAGTSQLIEMTVAIGDTGKANVNRIWGYGDNDNGLFFMLEGTTLNVMQRSKVTGSVVETKIAQADWNVDKLDGSGAPDNVSQYTLDLTKDNIYWIDLQWLGAGRVRFGVIIDGVRITCHEFLNGNNLSLPFMSTGSLPAYLEQENTGTAASSSEMRAWCIVIKTEGFYEPATNYHTGNITGKTITTSNVGIMTFRSKQQFKSVDNRANAYGDIAYINTDTEPVLIELVKNGTLGGTPTWAGDPGTDSSVEFDLAATTITSGTPIQSVIVPVGTVAIIDMSKLFHYSGEVMQRKADITQYTTYSFRATLLSGTTTNINISVDWHEVY